MIVSAILASPVERVRGGNIVISMTCTFDDRSTFTGIASITDEKHMNDGKEAAIQNAIETHNKFHSTTNKLHKFLREKIAMVDSELAKKDKTPEQVEKLNQLPPDERLRNLNEMCEALGIAPFQMKGEDGSAPWTVGEVIAMTLYFESLLKKMESRDVITKATTK